MLAPVLIALTLISVPVIGETATDQALAGKHTATTPSDTLAKPPIGESEQAAPVLAGIRVELECVAHVDGRVEDCVVVQETRPGLGFGAAAIALMNGATLSPEASKARSGPVKFLHTIQFTPD